MVFSLENWLILPESTGKSTLAQNLALAFNTNFLHEVGRDVCDYAGGNEVTIKFTNCGSLKIKYVYFTGYFLNAVGDKCRDEVSGSTVWKYTGVGPVSRIPNTPDRFGSYIKYFHSDPLFYSKNARKFRLSSVTIEYMNGKKTVLSGSELDDRVDYTDY